MRFRDHLSPVRVANFRWFFLGETVNSAGTAMAGIALAFAVLAIDDSVAALGWVMAAWTVPMVTLMLLGGAIADRLPRALVLRGCNLVQGVVQTVATVLVLTDTAEIWHLVVLQLVSGTVFAVSYPAFHGMVPVLLPEAERKPAYLLMGQAESVTSIGGPALSGVLVATVGPGWALAVDAATYFVAAAFLGLMRLPVADRPDRRPSVLGDFIAGWSFVRSLGWVLPVASCSLVFNAVISGSLGVLGPVIAEDTIGGDGWGFARAGQAVGVFVAAFFLARITLRRSLRACVLGFTCSAVPMLLLGTWVSTIVLAAGFLVAGAGLAVVNLSWSLTVQEKVPEDMLSRVMAVDGFFSFVAMPIGQVAVAPLVLVFGASDVMVGSAVLCLVVGLIGATRPAIRDLQLHPPQAAAPD
ncbi:MFS transporter [Nocardioides stalactiti]|uniref:MFS transporter n=1 Tax=Nocardioides stalactiti TaxID=2755356 RepID=UPI0015FED379|nr:MFS transporter [Nocardioides stalactiti]